ncbi:MAG: sodium:proton antiporter [Clostridiales bacterium]|nr:sodium:proton antiporter [Clostridiales bacterium]
MNNHLLWIAVLLPLIGAVFAYALGRRRARYALWGMLASSLAALIPLSVLLWQAANGQAGGWTSASLCAAGISLASDGFRALYAWLSALLWVVASVFSFSYFKGKENVPRFVFFSLLTLSAAVGLFLSDQLQTTVLFFEVMSLASYPWVAHSETKESLRAAQSYLWIAVIGGLCILMGMLLLPGELLAMRYSQGFAPETVPASSLMLPAVLMLVGFGAKAGAFPLHVWLPKAYPAAPAPATALLSAVLSKAGVFGVLLLSAHVMREVAAWHILIFWLGIATMLLGGVWALLSMNLIRVLAYSSMSQIGFILVGVGLYGMLSYHGGIAAQGLAAHMVNHSAFKMLLFLCAGVAVMRTGKRHLNDLRGFGRGKPLLHVIFLMGMLGIAGVPPFSGFASKSLLHESLTEYIHLLHGGAWLYTAAEWLFILAGGLTAAYMLKLYVCLFRERPEAEPAKTPYMTRASVIALSVLAVFPLLAGLFPSVFIGGIGRAGAEFLQTEARAVSYFSAENLLGAAESIGIGLLLYFAVVRGLLSEKTEGGRSYMNPVPARVNLEDMLYRPVLKMLTAMAAWFSWAVSLLPETLAAWLRRALLHVRAWRVPMPGGNRFTYAVGDLMNGCVSMLNKTILKNRPATVDFSVALAAGNEELGRSMKRLKRSLSYSLLLFCIGLFGLLVYLIFFK